MQTRLRDTTQQLMKALEAFYPFVKNAEEQIGMLEGDVANLTERKKTLDAELSKKIKDADMLIALDKKTSKEKLENANLLLENAQALYLELYKAQIIKIIPPVIYADGLMSKAKDMKTKVKEALANV